MDDRLLNGVRRFWSKARVEAVYEQVLEAYSNAATREVAITQAGFDGQNTSGQLVLDRDGMAAWMDVLEARLEELAAEAAGESPLATGSPITNFNNRYVGT